MSETDQSPARERRLVRKRADRIQRVESKILDALEELPPADRIIALNEPVKAAVRAFDAMAQA